MSLTLPAGLEVQPCVLLVLLLAAGVAELVLLVVDIEQVLDDGAGLPQLEAGVGVLDGRDTAVGVDGLEGLWSRGQWAPSGERRRGGGWTRLTLLEVTEVHDLGLVGHVQLLEDDGDLPWVGALLRRSELESCDLSWKA